MGCCSGSSASSPDDSSFKEWAPLFANGPSRNQNVITMVHHCTKREFCQSILNGGGFRFPTGEAARSKGLKLGAAVYFGENPGYCVEEALNTLCQGGGSREDMQLQLGLLRVEVNVGRSYSLGDYDLGGQGGFNGLSSKEFEDLTVGLTKDIVNRFGYDTITIFEGTERSELVVYDSASIGRMELVDLNGAQSVAPPSGIGQIPPDVAAGFLQALRDEYVNGSGNAVGSFLDSIRVSDDVARTLDAEEQVMQRAADKVATLDQLRARWNM